MKSLAVLFLSLLLVEPLLAQGPSPDARPAQSLYYTLTPALVGNYGSAERLKYYKADVALRLSDAQAEERIRHHEPLIRDRLVMLFAQQTEQTLGSVEAKEQLRQQALEQVRQVLEQEEGRPLVDDLLFNNLIVQ